MKHSHQHRYAEDMNVIKFLSISPGALHEMALASKKCITISRRVCIFGHDAKKNAASKSAMACSCSSLSLGHEFEVSCYAFAMNEEFGCKLQAVSVSVCGYLFRSETVVG